MTRSLDLIDKAMAHEGATSERGLAKALGLSHAQFSVARTRGRLSPELAGRLADRLGMDPAPWIAMAALEAVSRDTVTSRVLRDLQGKASRAAEAAKALGMVALAVVMGLAGAPKSADASPSQSRANVSSADSRRRGFAFA